MTTSRPPPLPPAPPPPPSLRGRRCLVTGGTRGLGRAIALAFARAGARVAVTHARDRAAAEAARHLLVEAGASPLVFRGSVADRAHVEAAVATVASLWGGIDVLVSNAAVTQLLPLVLIEEADWDQVMDVNVKGAFLASRAVLPHMRRAGGGHILAVGAFSVDRVVDAPVHYAASKAALVGFARALAREVAADGIRVNVLSPGLMDEGMARLLAPARLAEIAAQTGLGRLATPEEIAAAAVSLVADGAPGFAGAHLVVDGGL